MFGGLPNMIYVIDKTGKVVYKSTWTMYEEAVKVPKNSERKTWPR